MLEVWYMEAVAFLLRVFMRYRRLTKEELERRSKENMLTEVGDKALEAEEQVKVLRQRIGEMEEQMKKTEQVYKEQVGPQIKTDSQIKPQFLLSCLNL